MKGEVWEVTTNKVIRRKRELVILRPGDRMIRQQCWSSKHMVFDVGNWHRITVKASQVGQWARKVTS